MLNYGKHRKEELTKIEAGIDGWEEGGRWDLFKASHEHLLIMAELWFPLC